MSDNHDQNPKPSPQTQQAQQPEQQAQATPNRPVDTLWSGRVKAAMWERSTDRGPQFDTKISKTYTDKDGNARDTSYLSSADLMHAARVANKALDRQEELKREARREQYLEARTSSHKKPDPNRER